MEIICSALKYKSDLKFKRTITEFFFLNYLTAAKKLHKISYLFIEVFDIKHQLND